MLISFTEIVSELPANFNSITWNSGSGSTNYNHAISDATTISFDDVTVLIAPAVV